MTDQQYTHTCQVCKTEFPATLNKDGSVRKRKYKTCSPFCYRVATGHRSPDTEPFRRPQYGVKVMVCCKSFFGPLSTGQARRMKCCSTRCASIKGAKDRGYNIYHRERHCHGCNLPFTRRVRPTKDSGKFCSRECAIDTKTRVSREISFLRSLAERNRSRKAEQASRVKLEVSALRRIRRNIKARLIECSVCGVRHVRSRPFMTRCSVECERAHQEAKARRRRDGARAWKNTPKGRAARRADKAARRSRINRAKVEKIDPIAVFENANWVCHICGGKTLKSKRGTYHDRAPELEHIVALANGGTHTWANVACACRKCNIEKGANDFGQLGLL